MNAKKLVNARQQLGYTQKELGDRLGLSSQHVSRMERGSPISKTVELAVLRLLDMQRWSDTKPET